MFNDLKESFDKWGQILNDIKIKVDAHDPTIKRFDKLEQRVVGGWIVLSVIGIGSILMLKVYLKSIVVDVVEEVVANYEFEVIEK